MVVFGFMIKSYIKLTQTFEYSPHAMIKYWNNLMLLVFTPQCTRAVGVLFSLMVSRWVGRRQEEVCPDCISETVRCRKLILGRDIG